MKRLVLGLFTAAALLTGATKVSAQTFTTAHDTVYITYSGTFGMDVHNDITVPGPGNVNIRWKVVSENFSTDATWSTDLAVSICNNNTCLTNSGGGILNGTTYDDGTYKAAVDGTDSTDAFKATVSLSAANPGTHYFTVNLKDNAVGGYNKNVTFIVSKWPTAVTNVNRNNEDVTLYPNPATDDLNVLFDANRDIKNIAVYNVIGKTMSVYRVNGSSAKMDVSKLPGGVYFIRLSDSKGQVVGTKRFTKQ